MTVFDLVLAMGLVTAFILISLCFVMLRAQAKVLQVQKDVNRTMLDLGKEHEMRLTALDDPVAR